MPMRHFFADSGSLLVCYYHGDVELSQVLADGKSAYQAPEFHSSIDRLHVFHDTVNGSSMDMEALQKIKAMQVESGAVDPSGATDFRLALIIRNELQDAIMKLYRVLWDLDHTSTVKIVPFYTLEDGLSWLGRPDLALPGFSEIFEQPIW